LLLAERHNQSLKEEGKFFGYTARLAIAGEDVRLLVPTTFMTRHRHCGAWRHIQRLDWQGPQSV
jgi:peptidyl-tRNA hydrolase